jgi:hypothetical protein
METNNVEYRDGNNGTPTRGDKAMRRTRRAGHHRGWTARQLSAEQVARDIAASITAKRAAGITAAITTYTTRPEVIEKVAAFWPHKRKKPGARPASSCLQASQNPMKEVSSMVPEYL